MGTNGPPTSTFAVAPPRPVRDRLAAASTTALFALRNRLPAISLAMPLATALAMAFAVAGSFAALATAEAQFIRATPDDNVAIGVVQGSAAAGHVALVGVGLAPGPLGTPAEIGALSLDIVLKSTPAMLEIPGDITRSPNAPFSGSSNPYSCVFRFNEPVLPGDSGRVESGYEAIFFIPYNPLDDVFGDLGVPTVYHPQADIAVDVHNPYLGIGALSGRLMLPEFPEGRHSLDWRAGTSFNSVLDVALPGALIATFAYAEGRITSKVVAQATKKVASQAGKKAAAEAASKQADHLFTLVRLAQEAGLVTADITSAGEATAWYEATTVQTAVNEATQVLTVWDTHAPYLRDTRNGATQILAQDIVLEATDFGGVSFGRVEEELRSMFEPVDDCGKLFQTTTDWTASRLLVISDTPNEIEWVSRELENGPYQAGISLAPNQTREGEGITTRLVQRVLVRDTQAPILVPPPGFARYSSTPVDLTAGEFPLGVPRVVDLADPAPSVTNDAPDTLEVDRRYAVNWQASDSTGNVTRPGAGSPGQYVQVVTIKSPGTNTAPAAGAKAAATLTSTPVEIELTGTDVDLLDGRVDPLAFEIADYPAQGSFEAPLYPFFIEDFRLSPVGEQETTDGLTRTSPLGALADAFRLQPARLHRQFLIDEICNQPERAPFHGVIPVDFIYQPTYVHVDDDGFYYIRDGFWVCGEPLTAGFINAIPRISKWNEAGELVAMRALYPTESPLYDDTNLDDNMYPDDDFSVDGEGRLWIQLSALVTTFSQYVETYSFAPDLGDMRFHGAAGYSEQDLIDGKRVTGIAGDLQLGVVYELHETIGCPSSGCTADFVHRSIVVRDATGAVDLTVEDGIVGSIALPPGQTFGGTDLRADSQGNVYVIDPAGNRIHKFSATYRDERGEWVLGEYIGWLGSCTANLQNESGVPYNDCDEERGISQGYACTDFTCARAPDTSGSAPGQFDAPGSIVIDPRDVLYVGDVGNSRVQRFGQDGTFAGSAVSAGTGVNTGEEPGFILGNFGQPKKLAVNSSSFYVLDSDAATGDHFLHVFKTLPFYDVTDATARVKYVSDFDFQGRDHFTYIVDDGIDESAPAPVDVTVTRAFRPPERLETACFADESLDSQVPCTLAEDASLVVRIEAYDQDGFVSTGGLDTLTFEIAGGPANGALERLSTEDNSETWKYTPRSDFHGEDAFTFSADDGVDTATGGKAMLTVTPVPDLARISFGAEGQLVAGRGFQQVFTATYADGDADLASNPTLLQVDWGDGVTASAPGWQNSGRLDRNGREIDPQEALGVANGMLVASHVYLDTGNHALSVRIANHDGDTALADSFNETVVSVIEATKVSAALALPPDSIAPDTTVPARIDVTNHVPAGWAGLVAGNVRLSITVPRGLTFNPLDGRCAAGEPIVCTLGDLEQGETVELPFEASVALADARVENNYVLDLGLTDDGPNVTETNVTAAVVSIPDRDGDGTIDMDDAFPGDERYVADTDGDGLADAWERAFGYDPGVADDTSADADGDGFSLAEEFARGTWPRLADDRGLEAGNRLGIGADEDRFGEAIAGGDLDGDGYADTVIGAWNTDGGAGAVYIAHGSADGARQDFTTLSPRPGQTAFGRNVAVGDFDGNGWPDLAVASSNAVSIHYNNGQSIAVPDLVLEGQAGRNFGRHLTAGDLDGDGVDDLIVGDVVTGDVGDIGSGFVSVYLSTRGGVPGEALMLTDPAMVLGQTSAIGDVDGDGRGDLLLSNTAAAEVLGFLGADNDWSVTDAPVVSFRLSSNEPFGYGLLFGYVMTSGADIGGDGIDDLVITGWGGNPSMVHVFDSTTAYWDVATTGARSEVAPWITLDGADAARSQHLGFSVALAQLDGDGHADLVAGAINAGDNVEGEVRVFRGGNAGGGAAALNASTVFRGAAPDSLLGWRVAVPGDIDGDRFADIAGGAPGGDGEANGGYVQIYRHVLAARDPLEDPDGDGVGDAFDNCPVEPNTDQADVDGDAEGDVCDTDADGDGLPNEDDNCPLLASADQGNTDGDGLGDLCDPDDDNDTVDDIDDPFPLQHEYTGDTDDDGLPDEYETAFGLNPGNASDATADLDGDGRSNLDEFLEGFDIQADDVAPALTAPADVTADSIGAFTPVELGAATATDALDGEVTAAPSDPGPFAPGPHVVTWRATDAAGNTATATQNVAVIPQVNFVGSTVVTVEGASLELEAATNGMPVSTPVTIPYAITGTAEQGTDFELPGEDTLTTSDGAAAIDVSILSDAIAEGEESIVFTMGTPLNAVRGTTTEHTIRIVEGNVAPAVRIDVQQNGRERSGVFADDGDVTLLAIVDDPNPGDTHSIDWTATDGALVPAEGFDELTFTFNPSGLVEGVYAVRVEVTDSGTPAETVTITRRIRVRGMLKPLPNRGDSDGDGIDDIVEGQQDENRNGVDDRFDPSAAPNVLVTVPGTRGVLQAREGLTLRLGAAAFGQGGGALVTIAAIEAWGAGGGPALNAADDAFEYDGGIFDFELTGLAAAGESTEIVLALEAPIPAEATYRKYVANLGWQELVTDAANALASAPGTRGACPAPGSAAYTAGLSEGDWCVELTIEDGGPNDADGAANRAISDPGGVAAPYTAPVVTASKLSVPDRMVGAPASDIAVLRFRLAADDTGAELGAITLDASGTGNDASGIDMVRFWFDANGDGAVDDGDLELGTGSYSSNDGTLELETVTPFQLPAGDSDFIVTYDFQE